MTTTATTTTTETTTTYGADLQTASSVDISDPNDTDVWQLIFDAAKAAGIPQDSQDLSITVRGNTVSGSTMVFFQGLAPQANGTVQVMNTTSAFQLPDTPGVYTFTPSNFFLKKGWFIGMSTLGGSFDVAYPLSGGTLDTFSMNSGVNNGATFTGVPMSNTGLNLQATLLAGAEPPP